MTETITADEADHDFARVLREVEAGKEFLVTRDGAPVARIVPERAAADTPQPVAGQDRPGDGTRQLTPAQEAALARTIERLRDGWPLGIERFDRKELYDEVLDERMPWLRGR